MRYIFDTSVLVAGLRSRSGASFLLLQTVGAANLQLLASPALFLEYEAVLKREQHGLTVRDVDGFLDELALTIEPVEIHYVWRPLLMDVKDEMVIEAAINGRADAIVTHNKRDFELAAPRFGIRVLSPAEVLEESKRQGVRP